MSQPVRHIVYLFDKGFNSCSLVSLHSILARTAGPLKVSLHPTEDLEHLPGDVAKLSARFPDARIDIHELDSTPWEHIPKGPLPLTARLRLLLPRLHSGRVLYIDGDTLARKDLGPLIDFDMGGASAAAALVPRLAIELALSRGTGKKAEKLRTILADKSAQLGGIDMARYFNSGIMLFDLDKIVATGRDKHMTDIEATKDYLSRDQTFLNAVFNDDVALFDPQWNSGWGEARTANAYVPQDVQDMFAMARTDPGLLHFKGKEKPWHAEKPPFKVDLILKRRRSVLRARFWQEFQQERSATETLLGRKLWP